MKLNQTVSSKHGAVQYVGNWRIQIGLETRCVQADQKGTETTIGGKPTIGHLKSDYHLGRNFLKGVEYDRINALLAEISNNFRLLQVVQIFLRMEFYLDAWSRSQK